MYVHNAFAVAIIFINAVVFLLLIISDVVDVVDVVLCDVIVATIF